MKLNLLPPGIDYSDRAEARYETRINMLVNDGVKPAIPPANPNDPSDRQAMENHRLAVQMLIDKILEDGWMAYSPEVKQALLQELFFHKRFLYGGTAAPNEFDDDADKLFSMQLESFMAAQEMDLATDEGEFLSGVA
jgi:hypothetical protein